MIRVVISMTADSGLQPDQRADQWDGHVSVYEEVFEPFTLGFADAAIRSLAPAQGARIIDVGAGAGGAALELARRGAFVVAVDAAAKMVARSLERAHAAGLPLEAQVMDGTCLAFADGSFDAGLSIFGVILFPDAVAGLKELARVVRPGGRIALVTWTEPQSYELAAGLRASAEAILGARPLGTLPAQLRFTDLSQFRKLFEAAGLADVETLTLRADLRAPSADWLVARLAFAPGMAALLASFGEARKDILDHFRTQLEKRFGDKEIVLGGVAALGVGTR